MGARPEAVLTALATRCQTVTSIPAVYPMRVEIPTNLALYLSGANLQISRTGNQQRWFLQARGMLLIPNTGEFHAHAFRADSSLALIADAFDPKDNTDDYRLGGLVDRCAFAKTSCNLYRQFEFAGGLNVGHELFWEIEFERFKGDM